MFFKGQSDSQKKYYAEMLGLVGGMSRLFSEGREPYLEYRIAENLFCKAFSAKNLSRSDASADASKGGVGVGIKTFLNKNGSTMQKVAEFNSDHGLFRSLGSKGKVEKVAQLRNDRIETTKRIYGLKELIYHCVVRRPGGIIVYECPMHPIDLSKIRNVVEKGNTIRFKDGKEEYSFNISKSTLYKRFKTKDILLDLDVPILEDPFSALELLYKAEGEGLSFSPLRDEEHVFLPLYSIKKGKKQVPKKSGLNQWNAAGRQRNPDEVYIHIPAKVHAKHRGFFPERDMPFKLSLPDGNIMDAKVCQDNSKALMSNPNSALGEWLLRKVLDLKPCELLDYSRLERLGLDSVVVYKQGRGRYSIDFTKLGSYEEFIDEGEAG